MGLKTKNFEVKELGITLPEAYAVVDLIKIEGESGYALIKVQTSRENALNNSLKPFYEERIDFVVERNENPYETVYKKAKEPKITVRYNPTTNGFDSMEEESVFASWEDDKI